MSGNNELFDKMFDLLADIIDGTREDNDVRHEYWRIMSDNKWVNKDMEELTNGALSYMALEADNLERERDVEKAIEDLAVYWIQMDIAAWVISDRRLAESVSDDIFRTAKDMERTRSSIIRDIQRMEDRAADEDRSRARGREYGRGSSGGNGSSRSTRGDPVRERNSRVEAVRGGSSRRSGRGEPARSSGMGGLAAGGSSRVSSQDRREVEERVETRDSRTGEATRGSRRTPEPTRPSRLDGPDYTLARPFDEFIQEGEVWRPAHLSKWVVDWDQSNPFPTLFNPSKQIRFHVKGADGKVREEFLDMTVDSEYLAHELRSRRSRNQTAAPAPHHARATAQEGNAHPRSQEHQLIEMAADKPLVQLKADLLVVGSREEAELVAAFERTKQNQPFALLNYGRVLPVTTDLTKFQVLESVGESTNLTDAAARLAAAYDEADPALWNFLNERFSLGVTHYVRQAFGIKVKVNDFAADYPKLIQWMKDEKTESFARTFSQKSRCLIPALTVKLDEKATQTWLEGALDITEEEFNLNRPPVACYQDFFTVALVPFSSEDLDLPLTEESQSINSDDQPSLYAFAEKLFSDDVEQVPGAIRYILTTDRIRVEVLQGGIDNTLYLLRKMV